MNATQLLTNNLKYIVKSGDFSEIMEQPYNQALKELGLVIEASSVVKLTDDGKALLDLLKGKECKPNHDYSER